MGASDAWSIGRGVTYFDGRVFSNAIALVCLSGSLPLQADQMHVMALALAKLSNAPPGYDLARLRPLGPARIVSGEVINPIRELAFGFGPHPMQEVIHFFGEKWVRFLLEADKIDVFRVAARTFDEPDTGGPKTPEGYHLLNVGKTLDAESTRALTKALLGPQKGFISLKNCGFDPGVIFQIWRGKEYARLVVCFHCDESTLAFYDADGKVMRRTFGFPFIGRSTLLEMARKALPDDRTLDKL